MIQVSNRNHLNALRSLAPASVSPRSPVQNPEEGIEQKIARLFNAKLAELNRNRKERCDSLDPLSFGDIILELIDPYRTLERKGSREMDRSDRIQLCKLLANGDPMCAITPDRSRTVYEAAKYVAKLIDPNGGGDIDLGHLRSYMKSIPNRS